MSVALNIFFYFDINFHRSFPRVKILEQVLASHVDIFLPQWSLGQVSPSPQPDLPRCVQDSFPVGSLRFLATNCFQF